MRHRPAFSFVDILFVLCIAALTAYLLYRFASTPMWLAIPIAFVALPIVLRALAALLDVPTKRRIARIANTQCSKCNRAFGAAARTRLQHPEIFVTCPTCGTETTLTKSGYLKSGG